MLTVAESSVYTLILSSRKPEVKAFKCWLIREKLPAIRQSGKQKSPNICCGVYRVNCILGGYNGPKYKKKCRSFKMRSPTHSHSLDVYNRQQSSN